MCIRDRYRTGPIADLFFDEITQIIDFLSTHSCPIFVLGDLNIHVERGDDPNARKLLDIFSGYGLLNRVTQATHNLGGYLDVIFSLNEYPTPNVTYHETGLSDHLLLRWNAALSRPRPFYQTLSFRPWSKLDISQFRESVLSSDICDPSSWSILNIDEMADLFSSCVQPIIEHLMPIKTVRRISRPSDPLFGRECLLAKRAARKTERLYLSLLLYYPPSAPAIRVTW